MKLKRFTLAAMICLIAMSSSAQEEQTKIGFELNGGFSLPNGKINGTTVYPGVGFEALVHYRISADFNLFGGWGLNSLPSTSSFAGDDIVFEETGYVFGLQYSRQFANSSLGYFIRGGALINHIELENTSGDIIADSQHGLGTQIAAGFIIPLRSNWSINPGLKFSSLTRDIEIEGVTHQVKDDYTSVRVGIIKMF